MSNQICNLFKIEYPIIQGGMVWCSGWELAGAVSKSGGLGLIGAGSMSPEILKEHIRKLRRVTDKPFGVNLPLLKKDADACINVILEEKVPIVFTSAGNPATWTSTLKENNITVAHVIANTKFALKAQGAGVDAIVAEGFEAGGHNGREETTTMALIPSIREATNLPLIAAGGIYNGRTMLASMVIGAEGVQIGSRFAASVESSAHINFKNEILKAKEGDTKLALKKLTPVRLLKNKFFQEIYKLESDGAGVNDLSTMLGRGRSKKGMFEGDLDNGELEIGQISGLINDILPVAEIMDNIIKEFKEEIQNFSLNEKYQF